MNELILLVDDEPSIIKLAQLYFEREGFQIASASDGEIALEMSPIDIGMLLRSVVEKFTLQAQKAGIHLQTNIPEDPPTVLGDGDRLAQVLANLVDNALKFTPREWTGDSFHGDRRS